MRSHTKLSFVYQYRVQPEIDALRNYRDTEPGRRIPPSGFNRAPYIASFEIRRLRFVLVNVHLYFGSQDTSAQRKESLERRQLEILQGRTDRRPPAPISEAAATGGSGTRSPDRSEP